jgi:hypothetical protein
MLYVDSDGENLIDDIVSLNESYCQVFVIRQILESNSNL